MSTSTSIEWTEATWNPTTGCDRISPGCAHCYAKAIHDRRHKAYCSGKPMPVQFHAPFEVVQTRADRLEVPLHWRRPRRVFVDSMSDLFHEDVPDAFIDRVFAVMALCPQHTFQVLTKRPERMCAYVQQLGKRLGDLWDLTNQPTWITLPAGRSFPRYPENWPLPNVWLGVSLENQHFADERIPLLLQTPAAVRFISAEPLLGEVDLGCIQWQRTDGSDYFDALTRKRNPFDDVGLNGAALDWVIVGGESGPGSRSFDLAWARSIVAQCKAAGVACFVKQLGSNITANYYDHEVREGWWEAGGREWPDPIAWDCERDGQPHTNARVRLYLRKKGGDINEFPPDLRVREFPEVRA